MEDAPQKNRIPTSVCSDDNLPPPATARLSETKLPQMFLQLARQSLYVHNEKQRAHATRRKSKGKYTDDKTETYLGMPNLSVLTAVESCRSRRNRSARNERDIRLIYHNQSVDETERLH